MFALRIGERSPDLDLLLARHDARQWAYLTAENPFSEPLSAAANASRNEALCSELKAVAQAVYRGQGVGADDSWAPERSFLAVGVDLATALALARKYEQAAFVAGRVGEAARLIDSTTGDGPPKDPPVPVGLD